MIFRLASGPSTFWLLSLTGSKSCNSKLVDWLSLRSPELPREELSARAFVAVRSVRAVTIHVFAEAVGTAQKERVRGEVKRLLVRTLGGG